MTSRLLSLILALLAALALASPAMSQQSTPCTAAINCDCDNIEAGLLTGGWKADCKACQAQMIVKCEAAYPPLGTAIAAAGYCDVSCSVYGPNPTPLEPAAAAAAAGETDPDPATSVRVYGEGAMLLACPLNSKVSTTTYEGMTMRGCQNEAGQKHGLFVFLDTATTEIVEILFENDVEIDRTRRPAA